MEKIRKANRGYFAETRVYYFGISFPQNFTHEAFLIVECLTDYYHTGELVGTYKVTFTNTESNNPEVTKTIEITDNNSSVDIEFSNPVVCSDYEDKYKAETSWDDTIVNIRCHSSPLLLTRSPRGRPNTIKTASCWTSSNCRSTKCN